MLGVLEGNDYQIIALPAKGFAGFTHRSHLHNGSRLSVIKWLA
jgi:hypothetical protein